MSSNDRLLFFLVTSNILFTLYECLLILVFLFKLDCISASLDASFVIEASPPQRLCGNQKKKTKLSLITHLAKFFYLLSLMIELVCPFVLVSLFPSGMLL